jgi:hypothetical protein
MPEFNSPNFKRTVQSTVGQKPLREFTVGAPEDLPPEPQAMREMSQQQFADMEQNVKEARREKLSMMDKISDPAKRRIEMLANIGRSYKDVVLEGSTFSLRTLKAKETEEATMMTFFTEGKEGKSQLEANFDARRQQLARAIFKIDGQDVAHILGGNDLDTKLNFIDELEESVVIKLFDEFVILKEESRNKFTIKTEADAKEVADDLKK